jgi:hypothetical protein
MTLYYPFILIAIIRLYVHSCFEEDNSDTQHFAALVIENHSAVEIQLMPACTSFSWNLIRNISLYVHNPHPALNTWNETTKSKSSLANNLTTPFSSSDRPTHNGTLRARMTHLPKN